MPTCPTQYELTDLIDDELSDRYRVEIESHVESCSQCQSVLESLTASDLSFASAQVSKAQISKEWGVGESDSLAPSFIANVVQSLRGLTPPARRVQTDLPPTDIGDYRIVRELGRGGMGIVYEAEQRSLGRRVALKILPRSLVHDPSARERFQREARAAAALHHTNIVPIIEVGSSGDVAFYAMQLITGESLDKVRRDLTRLRDQDGRSGNGIENWSSRLRPAESLHPRDSSGSHTSGRNRSYYHTLARITFQAADALSYAHHKGIIHRDVKPSNLLLDMSGTVWITDFGLAKTTESDLTQTGDVVGTLRYISPERFRGQCDERADVYSLGTTLYELLTLKPAFENSDRAAMMHSIANVEPLPPRQLDPQIPKDLETIVLKAIEKEPARRYQTAGKLADDLRRFLDDQPIVARRATLRDQFMLWCRRNPALASVVAALLVVLTAGVAGTSWKWREAEQQRVRANQQTAQSQIERDNATWRAYRANIGAAAHALELGHVGDLRVALADADAEKHRGWEWKYFHNRLDTSIIASDELHDEPCDLFFSPDGKRVAVTLKREKLISDPHAVCWEWATGRRSRLPKTSRMSPQFDRSLMKDNDGSVLLTDATTGELVAVLHQQTPAQALLPFSRDGARFATVSARGIHIYHSENGELVALLEGRFDPDLVHVLGPHGKRLAVYYVGHSAYDILLFDAQTKRQTILKSSTNSGIGGLAFSHDGSKVAFGEDYPGNLVKLWDATTGELLQTMAGHENTVYGLEFNPSGSLLATTSGDSTARLWDLSNGRELFRLVGHNALVKCIAFSPDGKTLATGSDDQTVRLWDVESGRQRATLLGHTAEVFLLAFSTSGDLLASADPSGVTRIWDFSAARPRVARGHESFVYDVAFGPDSQLVASASWDHTVRLWNAQSGELESTLPVDGEELVTVAISPDGQLVAASSRAGALRVWDLANQSVRPGFEMPPATISAESEAYHTDNFGLAFCPNTEFLAGSFCGQVFIWNASSGQTEASFSVPMSSQSPIVFSVDGSHLVVGGETIRIWSVESKRLVAEIRDQQAVESLAFSRDGTLLASIGVDSTTVSLWDWQTRKRIARLKHGDIVYDVDFSPDGKRLATACRDKSIRLWDVARCDQVAVLRGHEDYVHAVEFSPDGTKIVSGSGDHTVRIWDTVPSQLRRLRGDQIQPGPVH